MKMQAIFDLMRDAHDILSFFEGVTTTEQMISRLERLKRQAPEDFAECIESLRFSVSAALEDNLELGGPLASDDEEADDIFAGLSLPEDESPASDTEAEPSALPAPREQAPTTPIDTTTTPTK